MHVLFKPACVFFLVTYCYIYHIIAAHSTGISYIRYPFRILTSAILILKVSNTSNEIRINQSATCRQKNETVFDFQWRPIIRAWTKVDKFTFQFWMSILSSGTPYKDNNAIRGLRLGLFAIVLSYLCVRIINIYYLIFSTHILIIVLITTRISLKKPMLEGFWKFYMFASRRNWSFLSFYFWMELTNRQVIMEIFPGKIFQPDLNINGHSGHFTCIPK